MSGSALGASADPVLVIPGNPEELRAGARNYTVLADRLEQAGHDMRGQTVANWRGQAASGYDAFREQGAAHYLAAADTARQSAAVLTARAQSIEDNRRQAQNALARRTEATRAAKNNDFPRGGPAWQAHLDDLRYADNQLAAARAADAQSAADTARKAAALHGQLPTTRLLADTSPAGEFITTLPAAANTPAPRATPPLTAPRLLPGPAPAPGPPVPTPGPGPGPTAPPATPNNSGRGNRTGPTAGSTGSTPVSPGPDAGTSSPTTNPAEVNPNSPTGGPTGPTGPTTGGPGGGSSMSPNGSGTGLPPLGSTRGGPNLAPFAPGGYYDGYPAAYSGGSVFDQPGGRIGRILGGLPDLPSATDPRPGFPPPALPGAAAPNTAPNLSPPGGPAPLPPHPGTSSPAAPSNTPGSPDTAAAPPLAPPVSAGPGGDQHIPPGDPGGQSPPTVPPDTPLPSPDPSPNLTPGPDPSTVAPPASSGGASPAVNQPAPAGHFGVKVAAGIFLAGVTVAAIVTAERHMRARQRRSYRPGSGRRDVLPTPPAIRSMSRAHHINPYRDHLDPPPNPTTHPAAGGRPGTGGHRSDRTPGGGVRRRGRARPVLPVGMRNNHPVTLDLAHGIVAFTGPGSGDVVRALILTVLGGVTATTPAGRVIMSTAEADELLGLDHANQPQAAGTVITADLAASLATATTVASGSDDTAQPDTSRSDDGPRAMSVGEGGPVVLIINAMRAEQADDTRATLSRLTAAGIGVVVLGEHPDASICDIDAEHLVTSVHGPAVAHLDGAHLFHLALEHLEDTFSPLLNIPVTPVTPADTRDVDARTGEPHTHGHADDPHDRNDDHHDRAADWGAEEEADDGRYADAKRGVGGGAGPWELRLAAPPDGHAEPADTEPDHLPPGHSSIRPGVGWHDGLIRDIGTREGVPLHYDLGAFAGLGLTGPGAPGAVRALWIGLIAPATTQGAVAAGAAEVIIPIDTADALLGTPEPADPHTAQDLAIGPEAHQPDAVAVDEASLLGWPGEVSDLDAALDQLESDIATRTHEQHDTPTTPTSPRKPIVLITLSPDLDAPDHDPDSDDAPPTPTTAPGTHDPDDPDALADPVAAADGAEAEAVEDGAVASLSPSRSSRQEWSARLRELSERGAPVGVAVIVVGHWAHGTTCHVDTAGRVSGPRGAGGFLLRNATLTQLDQTRARAFFDHGILPPPPSPSPHHDLTEEPPADHDSLVLDTTDDEADEARSDDADGTANPPRTANEDHCHDQEIAVPTTDTEIRSAHTTTSTPEQPGNTTGLDQPHSAKPSEAPKRPAPVLPPTEPMPVSTPRPPVTLDPDSVPAHVLLVVLVLGPMAVFARTAPGEPLRDITGRLSPTQRLIVAALAASTEPVHTEKLLGMCFANTGGADPVHRLHSHLTRLRTVLRQTTDGRSTTRLIAHTAERYHFTDLCWVDNHTLHTQLRTNPANPAQAAARSAAAFALYRGPLLDGMEYDTDTEWLHPQREHTLRTMIDLARQLADHLADTAPAQAATYLTAALHLDPYNDDTAEQLITHHLAHGHRHAAQHTLTQLTAHLAEIGETPRPETIALLTPPRDHTRR